MTSDAAKNGKPQNLLFDADDTLWENNIFFERVIEQVQDLLRAYEVGPRLFRERLNEAEREHIPVHGYGTANFARSLVRTFNHLAPSAGAGASSAVQNLALGIMQQPMQILDGVPETLSYLARRHPLFLVTKGQREEQMRKIEASGLHGYFRQVEILGEKDPAAFRSLLEKHAWDPTRTWMIGNSPRSDVNPALAAGMRAVFIPHAHTWDLEHEEPMRHPHLLELTRFADLRLHF